MEQKPAPGEIYRQDEKKPYQVVTIAKHCKTGEELVIYQELFGEFGVYAKPLSSFEKEAGHMEQTDERVDPKLMDFLEADSLEEKYNILISMQNMVTDSMIDTMAVVLDVVIPEGETMKRYDDLKRVIRTRQQYENANRLR